MSYCPLYITWHLSFKCWFWFICMTVIMYVMMCECMILFESLLLIFFRIHYKWYVIINIEEPDIASSLHQTTSATLRWICKSNLFKIISFKNTINKMRYLASIVDFPWHSFQAYTQCTRRENSQCLDPWNFQKQCWKIHIINQIFSKSLNYFLVWITLISLKEKSLIAFNILDVILRNII